GRDQFIASICNSLHHLQIHCVPQDTFWSVLCNELRAVAINWSLLVSAMFLTESQRPSSQTRNLPQVAQLVSATFPLRSGKRLISQWYGVPCCYDEVDELSS